MAMFFGLAWTWRWGGGSVFQPRRRMSAGRQGLRWPGVEAGRSGLAVQCSIGVRGGSLIGVG